MTRPGGCGCPAWAHWCAMDADSSWWCYEAEPHRHDNGWYENEIGRSSRLRGKPPAPDWQDSLTRLS